MKQSAINVCSRTGYADRLTPQRMSADETDLDRVGPCDVSEAAKLSASVSLDRRRRSCGAEAFRLLRMSGSISMQL